MCGLSGVAGTISTQEEEVAADLLYYNVLRGEDSTGVAVVGKHTRDIEVTKCLGPSWFLTDMKKYEKMMRGNHSCMIQHNRKATVGPKTSQFAHPFVFEHIVGAHNGSVYLTDVKAIPGQGSATHDSVGLLDAIDSIGVEETCKHLSEFGSNAWALTWYDKRDHSINFLRNKQRPLFYSFNAMHDCIFWSSEVEQLASAIVRNNITRKSGEKSFFVNADTHYKFLIPESNKAFADPVMRKVEYKKPYVHTGGTGNRPFPSALTKEEKERRKTISTTSGHGCSSGPGHNLGNTFAEGDKAETDERSRLASIGRDKFVLCYKDDKTKIYYDSNSGKFYRYFWDKIKTVYRANVHTGLPPELRGVDIKELIEKKQVIINKPLANIGSIPTSVPYIGSGEKTRFNGQKIIVTEVTDPKAENKWCRYQWNDSFHRWDRTPCTFPPLEMPDTQLDVNSRHEYKTKGKRKKRQTYYKGFGHELLTRTQFNDITMCGCISCSRTPQWTEGRMGGVMVRFINKDHFMCEYCAEDETLVLEMIEMYAKASASSKEESRVMH